MPRVHSSVLCALSMGLNFSDPTAVNLAASTPVERLDRPPLSILAGVLMIRAIMAGSVLAVGLLFAVQPAKATWVCGPDECVWVHEHVTEVVPSFAITWAPPIRPNCYWKRGIFGRWKFICP
jgi:hypothetical protein